MDKDLAEIILAICYRSSRDIGDIASLAKNNCSDDEYEHLSLVVAEVIYEIMTKIGDRVISEFPEIEKQVEIRMNRYGRAF
jgi:hypothetical protein